MDQTNTVEARLKRILGAQLGLNEHEIANHSKLGEDLGADSLDAVEIVIACEEEFNIEITDEDGEKLVAGTVGEAIEYLTGRQA
jgi:acyl carrier protein